MNWIIVTAQYLASYRIDSLEKNVSVIEDHQHASYRIDSLEILIGVICQMVLASYRIDSLENTVLDFLHT